MKSGIRIFPGLYSVLPGVAALLLITLFLIACDSSHESKPAESISKDTTSPPAVPPTTAERIISERIDGPANIRDRVNGHLLFVLHDQAVVDALPAEGNWVQIGIFADLNQDESDQSIIRKGSSIFVDGKEVGKAIEDLRISGSFKTNKGHHGELKGYTALQNIRVNTIPEIRLMRLLNDSARNLELMHFETFLYDFEFSNGGSVLPSLTAYTIDDVWLEDPSPLTRLMILFEGQKFFGVVHSRNLVLTNASTVSLKRGFHFTTFRPDHPLNEAFITGFNEYIQMVD